MLKWVATAVVGPVLVWWLTEPVWERMKEAPSRAPSTSAASARPVPQPLQRGPDAAAFPQPPPPPRIDGRYRGPVLLTGVHFFDPNLTLEAPHTAVLELFSTGQNTFSGTLSLTGVGAPAFPPVAYNVFGGIVRGTSFGFKALCSGCTDAVLFSGNIVAGNRIAGMTVTRGPEQTRLLMSRHPGSGPVPPGHFNLVK